MTNLEIFGTNINSNSFLMLPVSALDVPIYDATNTEVFKEYLTYDNEVIIGGMTINEYCLYNTNRKPMFTSDGLYAYYGFLIPLFKGGRETLENIFKDAGYTIGEEITDVADNRVFMANIQELQEWLALYEGN